jgi:hypothetical protein
VEDKAIINQALRLEEVETLILETYSHMAEVQVEKAELQELMLLAETEQTAEVQVDIIKTNLVVQA